MLFIEEKFLFILIDCHGSPVDGESRNDECGFVLRQAQDERVVGVDSCSTDLYT